MFIGYPLLLAKNWTGTNWTVISFILVFLSLLLLGLIAIQSQFGEQKMNFPLNVCNTASNRTDWQLCCENREDNVVSGYYINCGVKPFTSTYLYNCKKGNDSRYLKNVTGNVTFELHNGTTIPYNYSRFILPENAVWASFEIVGNDSKGRVCLSVTNLIKVPNYEEFKSDKENFIKYLLALLGFILLTVPIIITKMKKIFKG